jgi:hypothetical protein
MVLFCTLAACSEGEQGVNAENTQGGSYLNDVMIERIKNDWAVQRTVERGDVISVGDVRIDHYFGTYGDSVALMISDNYLGYAGAIWHEEVAGHTFNYRNGQRVLVWNNGEFYTLSGQISSTPGLSIEPEGGSYGRGLITAENVENILCHFEQAFPFIED